MNLGAFMNPEFPIFSTTLCYLEREDAYLMLHRIKKQDDYNHDKWVGVGGKFERFESPEDCLVREVREETGLTLTRYRARGLLTFVWGNMTEFIHLYTADRWEGEMIRGDACAEGELQWVKSLRCKNCPSGRGTSSFSVCWRKSTLTFPSSWCMTATPSNRPCWTENASYKKVQNIWTYGGMQLFG